MEVLIEDKHCSAIAFRHARVLYHTIRSRISCKL